MDAVEWGTVAQWVSGLATAGALFLTYFLLRKESKALELNRQQINRVEQDRELAQARLVSAWAGEIHRSGSGWILHMHVRNGSEEPITDVDVHVTVNGTQMGTQFRTLGPGADRLDPLDITESERPRIGGAHILFTDAEGRRWERHDSELRRVLE